MRPFVQEQLKDRLFPLIMAHEGGSAYGKENSLPAIRISVELGADLIEVDVKKSRDGILYCHHGSRPWGAIFAAFFGLLTFSQIQKLVGPRNTLKEILSVIPEHTLVWLDLKDARINADDLRPLIVGRNGIWIAPFGSISWLKSLRTGLGEEFMYSLNRPALFPLRYARQLEDLADSVNLYTWNWNKKVVSAFEGKGVICHLPRWFFSQEEYLARIQLSRWYGLFFSVYDMNEAKMLDRSTIR